MLSTTNAAGVATTFLRTDDQLALFDATAPVTQASADVAAAGSATVTARRDHRHGMPTISSGALTRAGGNLVEATTTSTSVTALLMASSMSIAAATYVMFMAALRKTTGAAATANAGTRINATNAGALIAWSSGVNRVESGLMRSRFLSGVSNYLAAGHMLFGAADGSGNIATAASFQGPNIPVATITDAGVTASVSDAAVTMGADELHVYTYSVS